jgi:hypothetical protein
MFNNRKNTLVFNKLPQNVKDNFSLDEIMGISSIKSFKDYMILKCFQKKLVKENLIKSYTRV